MSNTLVSRKQDDEKDLAPNRFWLKIYNEIQTDMRFVTMSHETQGLYFNLLVLANTPFTVGRITCSKEDLARGLRITRQKLDKVLAEYESKSLIFIEGDTIEIADERHYTGVGLNPSDSREAKAERMREHRGRVKAAEKERQREEATRSNNASPAKADMSNVEVEVDEDSQSVSETDNSKFFFHQEEKSTTTNYPGDWDDGAGDPPHPLIIEGNDIPLL